jgi:NADH-quinone oxidoreductase subunit I
MIRLLGALWISIRNVFRTKNTAALPWKGQRSHPERFRTSFALVHDEHGDEACIGCRMCEKICPSFIITVVPGGRSVSEKTGKARGWCKDFTLDVNACISCELCVQVCPTDAIIMLNVPAEVGFSREDLLLTMERLYANEKAGTASWGTGARLVGMQEPAKAPKAADKAAAEAGG